MDRTKREMTWEPVPWDAAADVETRQRAGFDARAAMALVWTAVPTAIVNTSRSIEELAPTRNAMLVF